MLSSSVLAAQSWTLYAIATSLIFSRIVYRRMTFGSFKKLQADDWLMVSVLVPFTAVIVLANQIAATTTTTENKRKFRYVLEELQLITTWLVKACLLVLYYRIFPTETSTWKRRTLKGITALCVVSFLIVQISLLASCHPDETRWDLMSTDAQCVSFHAHAATTLSFNVPLTICTMLLPVPFIPTPRRLLLAILFMIGTLILISSIISRALTIADPASSFMPLHWFTSESALSIIFANLPFLTSLVVATAPSRIKGFSQNLRASTHLALSQWPRSRQGSCAPSRQGSCVPSRRGSWESSTAAPPLRTIRLNSAATTLSEIPSPSDYEKKPDWTARNIEPAAPLEVHSPLISLPASPASRSPPRPSSPVNGDFSTVPKTRLSGGLAEMGDISMNNTQGWPIYWR